MPDRSILNLHPAMLRAAMCRSCHNKLDHEHGRRREQLDAAREKMVQNASA